MTKLNQYVLTDGKHVRITEDGTRIIVSQHDDGFVVELELPNGFQTEQQGLYETVKAALEAARRWAQEDWSDYQ